MIFNLEHEKSADDKFIDKYGQCAIPYFAQYQEDYTDEGECINQRWEYNVFGELRRLPYVNGENQNRKLLLLLWATKGKVDAYKFSPNEPSYWCALINNHNKRTYDKLDSCSYGHLLFAIFYYGITEAFINCVKEYPDEIKSYLCQWMSRYCSTFSIYRQEQITSFCQNFGHNYIIRRDNDIITLYKELGGKAERALSCFEMADFCLDYASEHGKISSNSKSDFASFVNWLTNTDVYVDHAVVIRYFFLLNSDYKCDAIRRYFEDIKLGLRTIDYSAIRELVHNKFHHLSFVEQILLNSEDTFNVTPELLVDSIISYNESQGQYFQTINGVIDSLLKYANLAHPDVDFDHFIRQWLPLCNGGVGVNKAFKGFLEGKIILEINQEALSIERLRKTYRYMLDHYIQKEYDTCTEYVEQKDGTKKAIDSKIEKDTFLVAPHHKDIFALFHIDTPEKCNEYNREWYRFNKTSVDITSISDKLAQLIETNNLGEMPLFSPDSDISFFTKPKYLHVKMKQDISSGDDSIISTEDIHININRQLAQLFSYNEEKQQYEGAYSDEAFNALKRLHYAQRATYILSPKNGVFLSKGIFKSSYLRSCTPSISRENNYITNSKVLYCSGDFCFKSVFYHASNWKSYKIIDLMRILGWEVTNEIDGKNIPKQSFVDFVTVVFRTRSLWNRMVCDCCEHVLFPKESVINQTVNIYNHFECRSPECKKYNEVVKLTFCTECKSGVIDSRSSAKCPNNLIICPKCLHCCDTNMFKRRLQQCLDNGWTPNPELVFKVNHNEAHQELMQKFCPQCGQELTLRRTNEDHKEYYCENCNFSREIRDKYRPLF